MVAQFAGTGGRSGLPKGVPWESYMSGSNTAGRAYYIPCLPTDREYRPVADEKQDREASNATSHDHRIHECADEEFTELSEGRSVQDVADGMEVLILRILNEPHCTWTHDISAPP